MPNETVVAAKEKLTRKEFVAWFASVGIDANELKAIEVTRDGIEATFYARNEDGNWYVDDADEIVTRTVYIPVEEVL